MVVFKNIHGSFLIIALLILSNTLGQQAIINVFDEKTKNPVVYAHVCFEDITTGEQWHNMTNDAGEVFNQVKGTAILIITYVGYETLFDTINTGESKTLFLKPAILNMSEVVVTAQYTPQRADKSIYKIKVIGLEQIGQKAANNLSELFKDELSIRVSQDAVLGSAMSIRGLSGEHVKFLIDGVPVIGRMNGNIDLGQINLNNVEHIEIIEGPMSVVYGSNALAGVVNILTRQNKNTRFEAFAETYLESAGVVNFNGSVSLKKKRNVFSLAAARNYFNGYSPESDGRDLLWKPKRQYSIDGSYLYSHSNFKLRYTSSSFNEKLWYKGDIIQPVYALDTYFYTRRFTNTLDVGNKIGSQRYLSIVAAYSIYDRIRDSYFKNLHTLENVPTDSDTTRFDAITFRPVISKSHENSKLNYQFGLDVNIEKGTGEKITDNKQNIGDYAGFLSIKYNPLPFFTIQPGVRFIYNTNYKAPLVYSLNLQWHPMEYLNLRASYARGFRAPSLKELYLYFVDVNHNIQGNDQLKAEDSHDLNISFDFNREKNKVLYGMELDIFYNKINNLITLAQINQTEYSYINVDYFISQGFQTQLKYNLYPNLTWKAGIAYTGRKNDLEDDAYDAKEFFYTTDVNSSLTYSFLKINTEFSVFYKYTGKTPQYIVTEEENLVEGYIPDYHTMDISLVTYFFNRTLITSAGIKNLFDNTSLPAIGGGSGVHTGGDSLIGWGRTFFLRVAYSFKKF